ncbi:protein lifeguard 2-like isoform X2 [Lampetra planeri]
MGIRLAKAWLPARLPCSRLFVARKMNRVIATGGSSMEYHQSVQHNHNSNAYSGYPEHNSNSNAYSGYPEHNSNSNAYSGYPEHNSNSNAYSGYPQYNPNSSAYSGYPEHNSNSSAYSGYPEHNSNSSAYSGYPEHNPNSSAYSGYPENNRNANAYSGYPKHNRNANASSGYAQYNPNANVEPDYPQYNFNQQPYPMASAIAYPPPYERSASGLGSNDSPPPPPVQNYENLSVVDDRVSESGSAGNETAMHFSEKSIRHAFIRKVYAILMAQLIVTIGIICAFIYWETLRNWSQDVPWLVYASIPATFILLMCLSCCSGIRRKAPCNFIFLLLFTLLEGVLLGSVSCYYSAASVMWAAGITAFISLGLTIFSFQTKIDFTMKSGIMFVFLMALLSFGLMCAILRSDWANIAYATLGALIFAVYLVIDTQLMMGGNHRYSLSPEEYIFAALNLYIDIVSIFLFILSIFQR